MDIRGKGVTHTRVKEIISAVGENYDGNIVVHQDSKPLGVNDYGFRGRVVARKSRTHGARESWSGRATVAACWHAYRDAIRAVLTEFPHAVVTTSLARYEGLAGFEAQYPRTADKNIGSMVQPAYMPDLCSGPCRGDSY